MQFSPHVVFVFFLVSYAFIYYVVFSNFWVPSVRDDKTLVISAKKDVKGETEERFPEIAVVVVACGDRLPEALVLLKSALIFTEWWQPLRLIAFTEDAMIPKINGKFQEWKSSMNNSWTFEVHPVTFPDDGNAEQWKKLFKPCACQRLFLPSLLKHVDSVLYMDTDSVFLSPLRKIWIHFNAMNSSQLAALAPEHEDPNTGWYNRFAHHPYYGPLGVNSGVMLMNLTRMREFKWEEYLLPIYKEYKDKLNWGDQDIINILFHFHPEKLYVYSCRYNYRTDHCMYMSVCPSAEKDGVAVLHGSRGTFHSDKQPAFRAVYQALEEYQMGSDLFWNLEVPMREYLRKTPNSSTCERITYIFTRAMEEFIPVSVRAP